MAEVTNELMLEIFKEIQNGQKDMKAQLHGIHDEFGAIRTHMAGIDEYRSRRYYSII